MPSLKTIRKRIGSVKSTQKITKAMKMVAAARLRRAQHAMLSARPYVSGLETMLSEVLAEGGEAIRSSSPLFGKHSDEAVTGKTVLAVFSSDRGLCGGFNANAAKKVLAVLSSELASEPGKVEIAAFGKKARDILQAKGRSVSHFVGDMGKWDEALMRRESDALLARYESGEVDRVVLVFNRFVSALTQEATVLQILPLAPPVQASDKAMSVEREYEPNRAQFGDAVARAIYRAYFQKAYLESVASELAARMNAMESATKNASEMIASLTLVYNRARQAAITRELMDIVNGAEAIS